MADGNKNLPWPNRMVVTIPASFDEVARTLTLKAAKAGLEGDPCGGTPGSILLVD